MRRVRDPDGTRWLVDVYWTGRAIGTRTQRRLARRASRRDQSARTAPDAKRRSRWSDGFDVDFISAFDDFGFWFLVAIFAIVLIVLFGPWAVVLLIDAVEVLFFPVIAGMILGWRARRRHAFTVSAARDGLPLAAWKVVGIRDARRIERAIAEAIKVGGSVANLFPEHRERPSTGVDTAG